MTTTTVKATLASVLDQANPNSVADALRKVKLGTLLTPKQLDTGTITGIATVTLDPPALLVQSARVVTSGTAGSVGAYIVADASATPAVPAAANTNPGVASLSADGVTLTFPNTITRAIVTYIPRSDTDMTDDWGNFSDE